MDPTGIYRWGPGFESHAAVAADAETITDRRARLVGALLALATLVNFLGPFAAGLWLAVHGLRFVAGVGLGLAIGLPIVWSFLAFRPATFITAPVTRRGAYPRPGSVMIACFLAAGWQYCVMAAWTLGVFTWFGERTYPAIALPMMLWAYGTIMGPFSYMASRDHGSDSSPALALAFAFVACLVNIALVHWAVPLATSAFLLGGLCLAAAFVNTALAGRAALRVYQGGAAARARAGLEHTGRTLHGIITRELPGKDKSHQDRPSDVSRAGGS